jgi:hypothetical protein
VLCFISFKEQGNLTIAQRNWKSSPVLVLTKLFSTLVLHVSSNYIAQMMNAFGQHTRFFCNGLMLFKIDFNSIETQCQLDKIDTSTISTLCVSNCMQTRRSTELNDQFISGFINSFEHLNHLEFINCNNISDCVVRSIFDCLLVNLTTFNVKNCQNLSVDAFIHIIRYSHKLTNIVIDCSNFFQYYPFECVELSHFFQNNYSLVHINMSLGSLSSSVLLAIESSCSSLNTLILDCLKIDESLCLKVLLQTLSRIVLRNSLTDKFVFYISQNSKLVVWYHHKLSGLISKSIHIVNYDDRTYNFSPKFHNTTLINFFGSVTDIATVIKLKRFPHLSDDVLYVIGRKNPTLRSLILIECGSAFTEACLHFMCYTLCQLLSLITLFECNKSICACTSVGSIRLRNNRTVNLAVQQDGIEWSTEDIRTKITGDFFVKNPIEYNWLYFPFD